MPRNTHTFLTIRYSCKCGLKKECRSEKEYDNYTRLHSKFCKDVNTLNIAQTNITYKGVIKKNIIGKDSKKN